MDELRRLWSCRLQSITAPHPSSAAHSPTLNSTPSTTRPQPRRSASPPSAVPGVNIMGEQNYKAQGDVTPGDSQLLTYSSSSLQPKPPETMKVLIVGASGMIGGEVLSQCLAHPRISKVIAFVRRDLPDDVRKDAKLESVVVEDFSTWTEDTLRMHADAAGMIWAMGSYDGSITVDLEYPLAFQKSMIRCLEQHPRPSPFRYVHLSGKFVRQNQDQSLWFLEKPRKLKGLLETETLSLARDRESTWRAFIVRPGGVVSRRIVGNGVMGIATTLGAVMGENWSVRIQELGAYMTHLAMGGDDEVASIIENQQVTRQGRHLLTERTEWPLP